MPISLSDDELAAVMTVAVAVPFSRRREYLREVANALAMHPEERGPGTTHREALRVARMYSTNMMRPVGPGARKYG
jgi:hypothetical protein